MRRVQQLVGELFAIVTELESLYPGRRFTIDGHLPGSIGEVLVAEQFGLTLHPASTKAHDAVDAEGRQVQIKVTTTRRGFAMRHEPERLIACRLLPDGTLETVYDGDGKAAWAAAGPMQSNGQRFVAMGKLRRLSGD